MVASGSSNRPWSAHESRLQADPIFAMRRRHWEGLVAGKKRLHRGQLLPGSTSEEELKEQLQQVRIWQEELCAEWRYAKMKVKSCVVRAMYPRRLMVNYLLSLL